MAATKKKRKQNPNSLKNLKMIQKGQVLNPTGRPKGMLTRFQVEAVLGRFSQLTKRALRLIVKNSRSPMLDVMVASIMLRCSEDGDYSRLDFLLNRSIGRVKEVMKVENDGPAPQIIVNLPANGREAKTAAKDEDEKEAS